MQIQFKQMPVQAARPLVERRAGGWGRLGMARAHGAHAPSALLFLPGKTSGAGCSPHLARGARPSLGRALGSH